MTMKQLLAAVDSQSGHILIGVLLTLIGFASWWTGFEAGGKELFMFGLGILSYAMKGQNANADKEQ